MVRCHLLLALLASLFLGGPAAAQGWPRPFPNTAPPLPQPPPRQPPSSTQPTPEPVFGWNPIAGYVETGQDEPGYRAWILSQPWRAGYVRQFHDFLTLNGVSYVAPTWQLLRTASDWRRCGAEPFEVPPVDEWPNIVNTLRYVRDHVVSRIGPVEPVSVFRNSALNRCAGGAPESVHQSMSAIDFVPLLPIGRDQMIRLLCAEHQRVGPRFNAGLGFYARHRFHVDSWRYRTWGRNDSGGIACPRTDWTPPPVSEPVVIASASAPSAPATTPTEPETATATDPLAPR